MWVPSLGQEDPLEEGTATHSSILAWRIPWTEEAGGLQPMESQRVGHDWSDLAQKHDIPTEWGKGDTWSPRAQSSNPDSVSY